MRWALMYERKLSTIDETRESRRKKYEKLIFLKYHDLFNFLSFNGEDISYLKNNEVGIRLVLYQDIWGKHTRDR